MKISLLVGSVSIFAFATLLPVLGSPQVSKQAVVGRWLRIQKQTGEVTIAPPERKSNLGERLSKIGDLLKTGKGSRAELGVDDGIGTLEVGELTELWISHLEELPGGAKRTHITINEGSVKLTLRKLKNPKSNVQIFTPAGTAAVRGTTFGVSLNGKGISGVATESGSVVVSGMGQKLPINIGFVRVLVPGKPPSKLRALPETVRLFNIRYQHRGSGQVLLKANTDPGNLVQVAGQSVDADEFGNFQALVSNMEDRLVQVQVTTPLNRSKDFRLTIFDTDLP